MNCAAVGRGDSATRMSKPDRQEQGPERHPHPYLRAGNVKAVTAGIVQGLNAHEVLDIDPVASAHDGHRAMRGQGPG
jgi:hypothetical protein